MCNWLASSPAKVTAAAARPVKGLCVCICGCFWVLFLIENGPKKNTCTGSLDLVSQSFSALCRNKTYPGEKKKNLLSTCSPLITHLLFCTVSTSYNLQVSSHTFLVAVAGLYLFLTLVQSCSMAVVLCFSPDPTLLSWCDFWPSHSWPVEVVTNQQGEP